MLDQLAFTVNAVLPILLLVLFGYGIEKLHWFPDSFFKAVNKFCFRFCLPVLLFFNIYAVSDIQEIGKNWEIIVFAVSTIVGVFLLGLLVSIFCVKDDRQKGVVLQCIFRSNYAIIGIPLATSLSSGNPIPIALASVISAISIPLFNVLAIVSLSIFIRDENNRIHPLQILKKIITNPLIVGVLVGILVLLIRLLIPTKIVDGEEVLVFSLQNQIPFLYKVISQIAQIASPLALIALGAEFHFSAVSKLKFQIILSTTIRVILVPAICLLIAYGIGFRGNEFPALIALFATPVAVSSVPMSAEMGNDEELAGQLVVWTSIFSAISLFVIIFICTQIGIFIV